MTPCNADTVGASAQKRRHDKIISDALQDAEARFEERPHEPHMQHSRLQVPRWPSPLCRALTCLRCTLTYKPRRTLGIGGQGLVRMSGSVGGSLPP